MSKYDELKQYLEVMTGPALVDSAEILELIAENERLRGALTDIFNHIEGNTEELVRELVNWGTPKVDPNEFYAECDAIKGLVRAALNEEASHV